jgi:hypothetical protein
MEFHDMNGFFARSIRLGASAILLGLLPTVGIAATAPPHAAMQNVGSDFAYGPIKFHPKQILISISLQNTTTAKFKVLQKGNTNDRFRGVIGCALNVGKKPRVKIAGDEGTIMFGRTGIPLGTNFLCQVTVLGEGGVTGILPVYVTVGL